MVVVEALTRRTFMSKRTKFVFVTGGVVSSIGKGLGAASIGALMEARGLKVTTPTPELERDWQELARKSWPRIRGTMVPAEMFDRVERLLAEYRAEYKK